nr:MAG TPA: hypothetical protein [Caudoviricetes sp.]
MRFSSAGSPSCRSRWVPTRTPTRTRTSDIIL